MASSRFVSGGTNEAPTERDEAWLAAQAQIDATHASRMQSRAQADAGKSLYEVLQANKAAKQEAFEESLKLSNQFQNLNEDDVEFLDSVRENARRLESESRREEQAQIDAFRKSQDALQNAGNVSGTINSGVNADIASAIQPSIEPGMGMSTQSGGQDDDERERAAKETWSVMSRKRKKGADRIVGGIKLRRTSTVDKDDDGNKAEKPKAIEKANGVETVGDDSAKHKRPMIPTGTVQDQGMVARIKKAGDMTLGEKDAGLDLTGSAAESAKKSGLLGLAAYSSDDDDE